MVDIHRLRTPALIFLLLLAGAVAGELTGRMFLGHAMAAIADQEYRPPSEIVRIGIHAAQYHQRPKAQRHPLVLITGLSTARTGYDLALMNKDIGPGFDYLNVGSSGSSIREIQFSLTALDLAELRPDWTLLTVNPFLLSGRWPNALPGWTNLAASLRKGDREGIRAFCKARIWLFQQRDPVHNLVFNAALQLRRELGRRFGWSPPTRFPSLDDPAGNPFEEYCGLHAPQATLEAQYAAFLRSGASRAERYSDPNPERAALEEIIRQCQGVGARVALVLPPEHSLVRRGVPNQAAALLMRPVPGSQEIIPVFDFRKAIPDDLFHDLGHLDAEGRTAFTHMVAEQVAPILRSRPQSRPARSFP